MAKKSNAQSLRSKLAQSLDTANHSDSPSASNQESSSATVNMTSTAESDTVTLEPALSKQAAAERLVFTSSLLAAGAGAIPVPFWDIAAVSGIQVKLLADISALYGVPFRENLGKSAVAALIGAIGPELLIRGSFGSFFKVLPGVGSLFGTIAVPALAGGATYAIGQVFIKHYESGGTLLTFSAKDFHAGFTEEVKAGMKKVVSVKI